MKNLSRCGLRINTAMHHFELRCYCVLSSYGKPSNWSVLIRGL
jgi:hypothetical protein